MKLTFLGTSAGKPTKERNVSALGLEFDQDNKWYLFDCGEGTQRQIIHSRLSLAKLSTIFITPSAWRPLLWSARTAFH